MHRSVCSALWLAGVLLAALPAMASPATSTLPDAAHASDATHGSGAANSPLTQADAPADEHDKDAVPVGAGWG